MLSLLGMGQHGKRMCHTFKLLKGGVSMFLPQSQGDQKEQGAKQTQLEQTPSSSKQ